MFGTEIEEKASAVIATAGRLGLKIATAESCTGGLVAGALTGVPGSSAVFERGFVTYSNDAKAELLGIPTELIVRFGAVSEPVANAMAQGALTSSKADVAVSITGIAGPGIGSAEKPIGLVHFTVTTRDFEHHVEKRFGNLGRSDIRLASVSVALDLLRLAVGRSTEER